MLNDFLVVGGSVLTLFLMMAVGFGLGKKKVLSPGTLGQISTMLLYIVCPIIVVTSLMGESRVASTVRRLLVSAAALAVSSFSWAMRWFSARAAAFCSRRASAAAKNARTAVSTTITAAMTSPTQPAGRM